MIEKFAFTLTELVSAIIIFGTYLRYFNQDNIIGYNLFKLEIVFLIFMIWAHLMCTFTDPGYLPLSNGTSCKYCTADRNLTDHPSSVHHCKQCDRCVYFRDHHCNWVSNCIGYNNVKYFILFTLYTAILAGINVFVLL